MRPGLGDCAPSGRIRLDALARWLQDIAYADVEDAGLAPAAFWVVRRTRLVVRRFPRFAEHPSVRTLCSGVGRMWAERRTVITGAGGDDVEALALWVHLDPVSRRPAPFSAEELAVYGAPAPDRRLSARLRHPAPPEGASAGSWTFRATDLDVADHVNNAAYWEPLEEELLTGGGPEPESIDAEIEFRMPSQPGRKRLLASGAMRWLAEPAGDLIASLCLRSELDGLQQEVHAAPAEE